VAEEGSSVALAIEGTYVDDSARSITFALIFTWVAAWPARIAAGLEDPDAVGGPVGGESSPDDPLCGHRAPEATVVGFAPVIAHHEPVTSGDLDWFREVAEGDEGCSQGLM
jgi:hypothetical protein